MSASIRGARGRVLILFGWCCAAVAGCADDWSTGPVDEVVIVEVRPVPFGAGDTVEVRGPGLGHADLFVAGEPVGALARGRDRQVFIAPEGLPRCGDPLPSIPLLATFEGLRDSLDIETLGTPIEVDLARGKHVVIADVEAGCRSRFVQAGTYGVAIFRTGIAHMTSSQRVQKPIRVRLAGGSPGGSVGQQAADATAAGIWWPVERSPSLQAPGSPQPHASGACTPDRMSVGDMLELGSPYVDDRHLYRAVSTSPHYAVLVETDSLAGYGSARRSVVDGLADRLEAEVHPFLAAMFHEWPDIDGDGQLHVVFGAGYGAAYAGAYEHRVDGCPGDFVLLSHYLLDAGPGTGTDEVLGTIVHEATHWYDIGPSLSAQDRLPAWTIEAVPTVAARLWEYEWAGESMWDNHELACREGSICWRKFLEEDRFGGGLSRGGGYAHGSYILQYLIEQVLEVGESPREALGRFRNRHGGYDDFRLRPIFEVLGGTDRSEAELVGEYLLSYYADENVVGASRRITQYGWNIPQNNPDYPLRAFRLSAEAPEETALIGRPDGTVFEIRVGAGGVLRMDPALPGLALAFVRAN